MITIENLIRRNGVSYIIVSLAHKKSKFLIDSMTKLSYRTIHHNKFMTPKLSKQDVVT